ncbi:MAG: VOC family protein [Verrucomicrobiales bacterium]
MSGSLHHLALGAQDVAVLASFYRDDLGLAELSRQTDPSADSLSSVWLDLGGGAVLMIEATTEPARRRVEGRDSGLFLLALAEPDVESLEIRCKALAARGILQISATEFTRYFRDPEGNPFALSCYPFAR